MSQQSNALFSLFLNTCESEGTSAAEVLKHLIQFFRDYRPNRGNAFNHVIAEDDLSGNSGNDMISSVSVKGQGNRVSQQTLYVGIRTTIK